MSSGFDDKHDFEKVRFNLRDSYNSRINLFQLPCGHKCGSVCHAGECTKPEKCDQRVKVKCKCKRKKKEFVCKDVQSGKALVECDDFCESEKARKQKVICDLVLEGRFAIHTYPIINTAHNEN